MRNEVMMWCDVMCYDPNFPPDPDERKPVKSERSDLNIANLILNIVEINCPLKSPWKNIFQNEKFYFQNWVFKKDERLTPPPPPKESPVPPPPEELPKIPLNNPPEPSPPSPLFPSPPPPPPDEDPRRLVKIPPDPPPSLDSPSLVPYKNIWFGKVENFFL